MTLNQPIPHGIISQLQFEKNKILLDAAGAKPKLKGTITQTA